MKTVLRSVSTAGVVLIGVAACGDGSAVSGRYVADIKEAGMQLELDFHKDGKATLTMAEGASRHDMDCSYESGERRVSVSCFGSSGISLTKLDDGDLEGDIDGMIVRYKKR